jgi:hypothetical protein
VKLFLRASLDAAHPYDATVSSREDLANYLRSRWAAMPNGQKFIINSVLTELTTPLTGY